MKNAFLIFFDKYFEIHLILFRNKDLDEKRDERIRLSTVRAIRKKKILQIRALIDKSLFNLELLALRAKYGNNVYLHHSKFDTIMSTVFSPQGRRFFFGRIWPNPRPTPPQNFFEV